MARVRSPCSLSNRRVNRVEGSPLFVKLPRENTAPMNLNDQPLRVAHIITRLIVGGAQENTLLTVEDQHRDYHDAVSLITGPGLGPEGSLEPRAQAGGFDLRIVPEFQRAIHPWRDWKCYRAIIRHLRELKPHIVHTHSSKAGIIGRWAARRLGLPVVHTIHGAAFHFGQPPLAFHLYQFLERLAGPWTDHFISVSDAMTDQYVAAGVAHRERFTTISSGFDVDRFMNPQKSREQVRQELNLAPNDIIIGKVARLFHLKGHQFVIQAAARVLKDRPHVKFLFVGDGILRPQYEAEIARLGLSKQFLFVGLVPPEQVAQYIHAMDIVVHTSEWEGLARVLPQGLIAGKPVVSFDIDGAREVVLPGETGFLVPRGDVEQLADSLIRLAESPELRQQYGSTGRQLFMDQFRHQTMTRRIREVYFKVLERKAGH